MPRKQHVVCLRRDDRRYLTRLVRTGRPAVATLRRGRILLLADTSTEGPAHTDLQIAAMVGVSDRTVARVRAAWGRQGLECLRRTPQRRPSVPPKLSEAQLLEIAAIACTDPPPGVARWSLRLVTARVIELGIVASICPETVRRALKKTGWPPGGSPDL